MPRGLETLICYDIFAELRIIPPHFHILIPKSYEGSFVDMNNKGIDCIALAIAVIGAINWGLIGFFNFDLVAFLFGGMSWLSRIIYALVGICGLYLISFFAYCGGVKRA